MPTLRRHPRQRRPLLPQLRHGVRQEGRPPDLNRSREPTGTHKGVISPGCACAHRRSRAHGHIRTTHDLTHYIRTRTHGITHKLARISIRTLSCIFFAFAFADRDTASR